ncbi:MAG: hypothetical protein IJ525_00450 [Alphaproteobacteria bacterium]|nr:hypothetical protein [Alphaproteobacteria bacterium]
MGEEFIEDSIKQTISDDGNLLDATQNAIIDAAENVSGALNSSADLPISSLPSEPFYTEVEFWLAVAFVLAISSLAKPLYSIIKNSLQNRIQRVVDDINEATELRDDAQKLLADYERKFVNVDNEIAQIIDIADKNLQNIKKAELSKLENNLRTKKAEAERRMAENIEKARYEVNLSASKISVEIAKKAINNYIEKADKSALIDEAIVELDNLINE